MAKKLTPYPKELKDLLSSMREAHPETPVKELLRQLFIDNPRFDKYKTRLTGARAHAILGALRRVSPREKKTTRAESFDDLSSGSELRAEIHAVAHSMRADGKTPRAILDKLSRNFPTVVFPTAQPLMRALFPKNTKTPVRTPVKKYAVEGDGFRIEITYHNPKMSRKIWEMVRLLIEE